DRKCRHVEGIQHGFEGGLVVYVVEQFRHAHQADAVETVGDEAKKVVAALFAVRDDVCAGVFLQLDCKQSGAVLNLRQIAGAALLGVEQPTRARPATDPGDGKGGQLVVDGGWHGSAPGGVQSTTVRSSRMSIDLAS